MLNFPFRYSSTDANTKVYTQDQLSSIVLTKYRILETTALEQPMYFDYL